MKPRSFWSLLLLAKGDIKTYALRTYCTVHNPHHAHHDTCVLTIVNNYDIQYALYLQSSITLRMYLQSAKFFKFVFTTIKDYEIFTLYLTLYLQYSKMMIFVLTISSIIMIHVL